MATATKSASTKPSAKAPVSETAEVNDMPPMNTPSEKKRVMPKMFEDFEAVDELPERPKRGARPGSNFGQSKWIKILQNFVDKVPSDGKWRKMFLYENSQGATTAKRELEKSIELGGQTVETKNRAGEVTGEKQYHDPSPEGVRFELEARPITVESEDGETVQKSILFAKWFAIE